MRSNFKDRLPDDKKLFFSAFHYAAIGMALVAPDGRWLMVNRALCELIGYSEEELLQLTFQDITHPEDLDEDLQLIDKLLSGEMETYQLEKRYFHRGGGIIHIQLSVSLVSDEQGKPLFFISQIQNITDRKLLELELVRQASEDMLTGVNNRRSFYEFAEREIHRSGRYHEPMVLLLLDIDYFKNINDTFGHAVGDQALKRMARTCGKALRTYDIFGRVGGEEFAVLLVNTELAVGRLVAERLRKVVEQIIIPTETGVVRFTVSLGGVAFAGNRSSLEARLKQADECLYRAKAEGRNRAIITDDALQMNRQHDKIGFLRLVWSTNYECGDTTIDAQHRRLLDLANELIVATLEKEDPEISQPLHEALLNEVEEHFATERQLLELIDYPQAEEHHRLHCELLEKAREVTQKQQQGELAATDVLHFLAVELVKNHLLREDVKFFPFVRRVSTIERPSGR